MQAVILAAGEGTRLRPLTKDYPKPLLPINNKPVILQVIQTLVKAGIDDIKVVIGYQAEKMELYVKSLKLRAKILFAYQPQAIGSADALICARNLLDKKRPFLVTAADTVFKSADLIIMKKFFNSKKPDALVAIKNINRRQLIRRSCVHLNPDGSIKQLIEKPLPRQLPTHNTSALPIFLFSNSFWHYLDRIEPSENGHWELATAIQDCIDSGGKVFGFKFKWSKDLTYPKDLLKHNFSYLDKL